MTHLLEDVLTISRAESTKIQLTKKPVEIVSFFETLKQEVERTTNETHTINLHFDLQDPILHTDPDLLRNIFVNLLNNAIKFSPGKTNVYASFSQSGKRWRVSVQDEGMGIAEEDTKNIFEPFYRAPTASVIQGTGLGLSIVKKAVDLLGGTLHVHSSVGEGALFIVTIPVAP